MFLLLLEPLMLIPCLTLGKPALCGRLTYTKASWLQSHAPLLPGIVLQNVVNFA